jgi:hypothetical protein
LRRFPVRARGVVKQSALAFEAAETGRCGALDPVGVRSARTGGNDGQEHVLVFGPKIKLDPALYESLKRAAETASYASVDEFIIHVLEKAAAESEQAASEEAVRNRLKGLGYLE